jgi:DinB superfamily
MSTRALLAIALPLTFVTACTTTDASPSADADGSGAQLELENLQGVVGTLHEKFTALAAAIPEDDLDWRPMEGVRSIEEVYIHIAADNFYVPALMGWEAPAETEVTDDVETFRAYQDREMTRDEMLEAVEASFAFFRASMAESAGALDREVVLREPTTVGDVWIRAVVHLHEHLGQSIAYARSKEVAPPWSR